MTAAPSHVVLGATGVVGRETTAALSAAGLPGIAASRSGAPSAHATSRSVDLTDAPAVIRALEAADVAYLTAGLPYTTRAWRTGWPRILRNTIDACVATGTHLVYFDNVYAYGSAGQPMTESTPIRPSSRKGQVRAALLDLLDTAAREQGLVVTVGRAADFYGPGATTSVFNAFAIDRIRVGAAPIWLFDATLPHSMTYTPDIGAALALLGTDPKARAQVWHLPTAPALTGEEYLTLASGGEPSHRTMSRTTMRIGALFDSGAREGLEMAYQNTRPYLFDSTAFERTFGILPTPYAEGIRAALAG